ncbi:MAG: cyclic nucleotide-binding domain-containing protein [Deltaproteobacteria bacterium]|nr:cyclic nucleotide-binding domain-containing protein [Deltaproteobacteria bacterium]
MDHPEMKQILENCDLFKGLDQSDISKIAGLCEVETYEQGEYVFRQGDFGDSMYVISEGQVFLERSRDMGVRKGNAVIGILGKGRAFGCWSALLDEAHTLMSSVLCQKPTKVVVIKGKDLRDMMINDVSLGFHVLERLCILLRDRIQGALGAMERV